MKSHILAILAILKKWLYLCGVMEIKQMQRYFILGYMGAGKSRFSRKLASSLGLQNIDLDLFIEHRYCKTVAQLFTEKGEAYFRKIEQLCLIELCSYENIIVSLGGGTPCFFDNIDLIKQHGCSIFLDLPEEELFIRLKNSHHKRPLLQDKTDEELKAFIHASLKKRRPFYEQATLTLSSSSFTPETLEVILSLSNPIKN